MKLAKILSFLILPFIFLCAEGFSQSADEITARVQQRLPQLDALKLDGKIGENNQGYVEAVETLSGREQSLIQGENDDRRALYQIVAQRTGQSIAEVGRQRAVRIAQQSRSGLWLQDSGGAWYQKP